MIRLIRNFAWFHAMFWNCADQIDQDTENISNFVNNQSLWSSNSGIHLIMFGFEIRQVRLIRDVWYQVKLWIWATQTYQTCAWFLAWLWNWTDQTNQTGEFWKFVFKTSCSGLSDIHVHIYVLVSSRTVQADQECISSSMALNWNCSDSSDMWKISLPFKLSWSD